MPHLLASPPSFAGEGIIVTIPRKHVLVVTLDRPRQLNSLPRHAHQLLYRVWVWYDNEPSLRCAILTGGHHRAFCTGADLREWKQKDDENMLSGVSQEDPDTYEHEWAIKGGFGGMSNRRGKKPIIAAVNGLCYGGGFEIVINADIVLASEDARFGLPEVTVGVAATSGALPRLTKIIGRQRAAEIALMGKIDYSAKQMLDWGIVNRVVPSQRQNEKAGRTTAPPTPLSPVIDEALRWAETVANNSPDAVIVTRAGLMGGWDGEDPQLSTRRVGEGIFKEMNRGENMNEGLRSFAEKRRPVWKDSKL